MYMCTNVCACTRAHTHTGTYILSKNCTFTTENKVMLHSLFYFMLLCTEMSIKTNFIILAFYTLHYYVAFQLSIFLIGEQLRNLYRAKIYENRVQLNKFQCWFSTV